MADTARRLVGGSFAPALTDEKLVEYRELANTAEPAVRDAMLSLCKMVDVFHETPASSLPGKAHDSGRGTVTPLTEEEKARIWDVVPYAHEIEGMRQLFDAIPADSSIRTPAHHLLWYAVELEKDREPITIESL